MNVALPVAFVSEQSLPALIDRAAHTLSEARTSAEILEAREMASFAYDIAKKQARLAKAKKAHDDVIGAVYRAQADALEIEAGAKRRLADEYNAAQERGEVARNGQRGPSKKAVPDGNGFLPSAADLGLSRKDIHEARQIRDAERASPGIVREALDATLSAGGEPNRAAVREAVLAAINGGLGPEPTSSRKNPHYVHDPAFDAASKLTGCCRTIVDLRKSMSLETIFAGFLDSEMRDRNLRTIRVCRDLLTEILEHPDVA